MEHVKVVMHSWRTRVSFNKFPTWHMKNYQKTMKNGRSYLAGYIILSMMRQGDLINPGSESYIMERGAACWDNNGNKGPT